MRDLIAREPVRVYLYGVLVAIVAVLVGYGVLDGSQAALWLALGSALLAVPAVEAARSRVSPTSTARHAKD